MGYSITYFILTKYKTLEENLIKNYSGLREFIIKTDKKNEKEGNYDSYSMELIHFLKENLKLSEKLADYPQKIIDEMTYELIQYDDYLKDKIMKGVDPYRYTLRYLESTRIIRN